MDLGEIQLMNAAGWCKDLAGVQKLARTPVSEINVGSITLDEQVGNAGSVFWQAPGDRYALNSLGLRNLGLANTQKNLDLMCTLARSAGKGLRVNIAGSTPSEYFRLTSTLAFAADTIEVNLGCPNVWGPEGQKPIASFNPALAASIINKVGEAVQDFGDERPRIAIKLSPYSDPAQMDAIIEVILKERGLVDEVVTSNTFPNAFAWNDDKPAITPGGGFAGMSGKAMKAIALGQAIRLRTALAPHGIQIVGVGGISSGKDIFDFVRAGVTMVQIGTYYFIHGERVFSELLTECSELVG